MVSMPLRVRDRTAAWLKKELAQEKEPERLVELGERAANFGYKKTPRKAFSKAVKHERSVKKLVELGDRLRMERQHKIAKAAYSKAIDIEERHIEVRDPWMLTSGRHAAWVAKEKLGDFARSAAILEKMTVRRESSLEFKHK